MNDRLPRFALVALVGAALCWAFWKGDPSARTSAREKTMEPATEAPGHPKTTPDAPAATVESAESFASMESDQMVTEPGPVAPLPRAASLAAMARVPVQVQSTQPGGPANEPEDATVMPVTALENLRSAFRQYAARFGGNPEGDNAEMTAALTGQNVRHQVFVASEDGLRRNGQGQFVDNWGTPYFFHQLSRTETEIRSAGPDKRMWTSDDLVMK